MVLVGLIIANVAVSCLVGGSGLDPSIAYFIGGFSVIVSGFVWYK